jgi:hypothetical protein
MERLEAVVYQQELDACDPVRWDIDQQPHQWAEPCEQPPERVLLFMAGSCVGKFHDAIIIDAVNVDTGIAVNVSPRKSGSIYYLYSWRSVTPGNYAHYIPAYGYNGDQYHQSTSRSYYSDSSGGTDQVDGTVILGSTGDFSDLSYTVYRTMKNLYGYMVW